MALRIKLFTEAVLWSNKVAVYPYSVLGCMVSQGSLLMSRNLSNRKQATVQFTACFATHWKPWWEGMKETLGFASSPEKTTVYYFGLYLWHFLNLHFIKVQNRICNIFQGMSLAKLVNTVTFHAEDLLLGKKRFRYSSCSHHYFQ